MQVCRRRHSEYSSDSIALQLKDRPGFPHLRIVPVSYEEERIELLKAKRSREAGWVYVEWGEPRPLTEDGLFELDGTVLGGYYGYSEAAIADHARRKACPCKYCVELRMLHEWGWEGTGRPHWIKNPVGDTYFLSYEPPEALEEERAA